MKKITQIATAVALATSVAMPAFAAEGEGNAAITTDYIWRGASQTGNGAALQGGYDWTSGAISYGIWGSNVNYGGVDSGVEVDLYGAYSGEISEDMGWSVGYIYYYTNTTAGSASEISIGGSYQMVSLDYYINVDDTSVTYTDINAEFEAGSGTVGVNYGTATGYTTYGVSYGMEVSGYDVSLAYASSDAGGFTDSAFALTVGMTF
jgi:uncharacterized protein (TIGR02001 family)